MSRATARRPGHSFGRTEPEDLAWIEHICWLADHVDLGSRVRIATADEVADLREVAPAP